MEKSHLPGEDWNFPMEIRSLNGWRMHPSARRVIAEAMADPEIAVEAVIEDQVAVAVIGVRVAAIKNIVATGEAVTAKFKNEFLNNIAPSIRMGFIFSSAA
jgi:hypothetical protein